MKKHILSTVITLALISIWGCKKAEVNDLSGDDIFNGIVALRDTLSGSFTPRILANQAVQIRYSQDQSGFLYAVQSDINGKFTFDPIDAAKQYTIFSQLTSGGITYRGNLAYPTVSARVNAVDTLTLSIDEKGQNGIYYNFHDLQGGRVPHIACYLYTNKSLWERRDTSAFSYLAKSDQSGRLLKLNVVPATYYIYAVAKFNSITSVNIDTVTVREAGIRKKYLKFNF